MLSHDNAPAHRPLLVTDFLVNTKTTPNSCDLKPCDFSLFRELVPRFLGHRIQSADEVESASQAELKDMSKHELQKCFDYL
ncbi:hypothetical protein TNCV_1786621 [Trichonephila clavipes]|nr:hypothetical protein TNCV_1786621 [Trichonephila clavipes]